MFDIKTSEKHLVNFVAGPFPIVADYGTVEADAEIRPRAPIVQDTDGIKEATATTLDKLIGISAAEPSGDEVIYYMTGEFFTQALVLPPGVTAEALKPELRKLGIFLRERSRLDGDPTPDDDTGANTNGSGGTA
ncbi:MAG: hypothetical protein FWC70_10005 [Defluviitaleaceae bacterium]|nr:hypothetical protein [Defluviitaleaceae bacterium]